MDSLMALYMIRIRSQNGSKDFCITSSTSIWLRYSAGYDTKKYSPQMGVDHVPLQNFTIDLVLTLCI